MTKTAIMSIAIVGATGRAGSRILEEAVRRGHRVTALARRVAPLAARRDVQAVGLDVRNRPALESALKGHDVVIHALNPDDTNSQETRREDQRDATVAILAAMKAMGIRRLVAVGGAGTLRHEGVLFMNHPSFPAEWRGGAVATSVINELLYADKELDWTILSPSHWFRPGTRTGKFRLGSDELLVDLDGESRISMEDYAIALLDEVEHPRHSRKRFTVGY